MRHRKLLAGIGIGALAAIGGFGFGPGDADGPPEGTPSDNACSGIEEAQDRVGEDNPAAEILEQVEEMLAGECDDGAASDRGGDNGSDRP